MLSAISRVFEKINIFFLSLLIATVLGTEVFAEFAVAMSYALIMYSIVEVGGQQLFTYFNRDVGPITPRTLNALKFFIFIVLLPLTFISTLWTLTCLISLAYLVESFNNSMRFQLFHKGLYKKEALIYLAERIVFFITIMILYANWMFGFHLDYGVNDIFIFFGTLKLISFITYYISTSNQTNEISTNIDFQLFVTFIVKGKYFIVSAFVASLFMQVDILIFSWLGGSDKEIALISAFIRLVTATFFVSTVFQQFILPKFKLLISNHDYFNLYEKNVRLFAFFLTLALMSLSNVYLLVFFGDNIVSEDPISQLCVIILVMVFSRFCRDPISLYLGQSDKNKVKVKVLSYLLPIKVVFVCLIYKVGGIPAAISLIVLFDALVYFFFRYATSFITIDKSYCVGVFLLTSFVFVVEYIPFEVRMSLATLSLIIALTFFNKVTKPEVLFS